MDSHNLKRPPAMGEMKRVAEAQALTLRAELRARMQMDRISVEDVAQQARLEPAAIQAFLDGNALNPRWQAKLEHWLATKSN